MESGLYLTFFNKGEPDDRALPPVGPLDHVVLRHRKLVAERGSVQQAQELAVSIDRWLEAELELQRATGEEPGGTKRREMRLSAEDGVYLRFAVFAEAQERDAVPELGPFALIVVGPRAVEGDGQLLASRSASDLAPWELTSGAGDDFAGLHKPDIAFRNANGAYHSSIAPAPTARVAKIEPVFAPPLRTEPLFTTPPPALVEPAFTPPPQIRRPTEEVSALTARDLELIQRIERERAEETLRARIQEEERHRLGVAETTEDDATSWAMRYRPQGTTAEAVEEAGGSGLTFGALLWRMRFAIIGVLLVGVGAYGFIAIRTGTAPNVVGVQQFSYVGMGAKFSGTRWDWVVNSVQRAADAGNITAQGIYYVVRVGATNKGTDGAQLAPNDFVLLDANGVGHSALGLASGAYQTDSNAGSPNIWPREFPIGRTVNFNVVFDIDPSLGRGMNLGIADAPKTRVHLD